MIQVRSEKENLVLLLNGNLSKDFSIPRDLISSSLKGKKYIVLKNNGISDWDQSSVITLYSCLKYFSSVAAVKTQDLPEGMEKLLLLAFQVSLKKPETSLQKEFFLERVGTYGLFIAQRVKCGFIFLRQVFTAWNNQLKGEAVYRKKDFWIALEDCGPNAIMIVSLISFMVGLILAFVGALQLKTFGAQVYVASLVTIGMIRIMGAIMTGIIMAGRTGASYAATIGTMQVNEELDALQTMGIPKSDFIVLPRINAVLLSMPVLVLISDFMGIFGGGCVCVFFWDIPLSEYIRYSTMAFSLEHFFVGIFHGLVFGFVITVCGCYFGITCGRNADSVGKSTTDAVVYAIVWMIVMTGIITLICEGLGI
ncbi:MAG: ABC transporter permease [Alphaproteobacteria bacterium]|nr:ABC transporter permease [Alphaproteobacteria bacterium]